MMKEANSRLSRYQGHVHKSVADDFKSYDRLPPAVRYKIGEMAQLMSCSHVGDLLKARGHGFTLYALDRQEMVEIGLFARQYRSETGQDYPFIVARASIQRYSNGITRTRSRRNRLMLFEDEVGIMKVPAAPRWRGRRH